MVRPADPELKKYMNKKILFQLNANRKVSGVLRGYDAFMNIVLDEAIELIPKDDASKKEYIERPMGMILLRGNSIVMMESFERSNIA